MNEHEDAVEQAKRTLRRSLRSARAEQGAAFAAERAPGIAEHLQSLTRSLGARSLLADPRDPGMRERLNRQVKKRETFRPFAPIILKERASEHLDLDHASPFMLETCQVRSRLDLPAVTHVDGSARPQTVDPAVAPRLAALLEAFAARTGCPMLLNTSFNVRGEPIVCSPEDAFRCFMGSEIEVLVVGNCLLRKEDQDPTLKLDYKHAFEMD